MEKGQNWKNAQSSSRLISPGRTWLDFSTFPEKLSQIEGDYLSFAQKNPHLFMSTRGKLVTLLHRASQTVEGLVGVADEIKKIRLEKHPPYKRNLFPASHAFPGSSVRGTDAPSNEYKYIQRFHYSTKVGEPHYDPDPSG
jgi:hypothetical protein